MGSVNIVRYVINRGRKMVDNFFSLVSTIIPVLVIAESIQG